jgi:hypothetical protein
MTVVERAGYRLELLPNGLAARLSSPRGEHWATLRLFAALDRVDGPDETLSVELARADGDTIEVERRSTVWERAGTTLVCRDGELEVHTWVAGRGSLAEAHLLGGRSLIPGAPTGLMPSGSSFRTLFSPNPGDPAKLVRSAAESAVIGVAGDGTPGRGHWFFTPAPLYLALTTADRREPGAAEWMGLGVAAPVDELTFVQLEYRPGDLAFELVLDYEGPAAELATQQSYDEFLAQLERHDLIPGTIAIDDKWQDAYGTNRPDTHKWPDLAGWIAERHEHGQRVLLWWKAWDPEGLPAELCIRTPEGRPAAVDPTNPRARDALRESVAFMLGREGLDADGLKVDFTARTPSGRALSTHAPNWGIALLHELLSVVYVEAKNAKADALLIAHTPHPGFVDVTDMIRLNDMLRMDDPGPMPPVVPQMRYRAEVARAACPELPIDTDDWAVPDKTTWREYLEAKPELGVPSLYYATRLDGTGEQLDEDDYAALRETWSRWRAAHGAAPVEAR